MMLAGTPCGGEDGQTLGLAAEEKDPLPPALPPPPSPGHPSRQRKQAASRWVPGGRWRSLFLLPSSREELFREQPVVEGRGATPRPLCRPPDLVCRARGHGHHGPRAQPPRQRL